ncbi:MAG: hypothetical protein IPK02_22665 [Candidatus Accumulibacter sp.]|uniref:Uncharacterized protein n=1 Tax=Candidatus Accumulibacter affinis TaxID=2954384 RepID=A0A935W6Y3_9PROT|nr:hypothetical protein [Candidatus Accumulibacter affinis]
MRRPDDHLTRAPIDSVFRAADDFLAGGRWCVNLSPQTRQSRTGRPDVCHHRHLVNDTRFVLPQALSDGFALVKVSVTSQCPEGVAPVPASSPEHRFLIDARSACAVSGLVLESV